MDQTREGSLEAQTSEQQEGKREAWMNTGFGSQICALGNSENKIALNKSGENRKKWGKEIWENLSGVLGKNRPQQSANKT